MVTGVCWDGVGIVFFYWLEVAESIAGSVHWIDQSWLAFTKDWPSMLIGAYCCLGAIAHILGLVVHWEEISCFITPVLRHTVPCKAGESSADHILFWSDQCECSSLVVTLEVKGLCLPAMCASSKQHDELGWLCEVWHTGFHEIFLLNICQNERLFKVSHF